MGQYFKWINVEKKEYICPYDFALGCKRVESSYKGNPLLCALRELFSQEWKGDKVIFIGDEFKLPDNIADEPFKTLYEHTLQCGYPGDSNEAIIELYKNVSCLFKEAEEIAREEIGYYIEDLKEGKCRINEYGINTDNPFERLFLRKGKSSRYTINHTKKVYYESDAVKVFYPDNTECKFTDPLPLLMCYVNSVDIGPWVGDIIGVSDEKIDGYTFLKEVHIGW